MTLDRVDLRRGRIVGAGGLPAGEGAWRSLRIGGQRLRTMQQFTFDVSAEGLAKGERFRREILLGPFTLTDDLDYCDPTGEAHEG